MTLNSSSEELSVSAKSFPTSCWNGSNGESESELTLSPRSLRLTIFLYEVCGSSSTRDVGGGLAGKLFRLPSAYCELLEIQEIQIILILNLVRFPQTPK